MTRLPTWKGQNRGSCVGSDCDEACPEEVSTDEETRTGCFVRGMRTFRVVRSLVGPFSPDARLSLAEDKEDDSPPERHYEPIASGRQSAHLFAELDFGDGGIGLNVVEDDLVWCVEGRGGAADEEDEVGPFERQADRQASIR